MVKALEDCCCQMYLSPFFQCRPAKLFPDPSSRNGLSLLQNYTSSIVLESFKLTGSMSCGIISFILAYLALAIAIGYTKTQMITRSI